MRNYQWWQDHGGEWAAELDRRRNDQPIYQEIRTALLRELAPFKGRPILEFGVGTGHNLRDLVDDGHLITDLYGIDQSKTIVQAMESWTSKDWRDSHVKIFRPNTPIRWKPSYDVIFTCTVLMHMPPDDAKNALRQLQKLAQTVILIEPRVGADIDPTAHDGCWVHPFETWGFGLTRKYDLPSHPQLAVYQSSRDIES